MKGCSPIAALMLTVPLVCLTISNLSLGQQRIAVSGPALPPYLYLDSQQNAAGQFLEVLDCIFDGIDYSYDIAVLPALRSLHAFHHGKTQAALLVSSSVDSKYQSQLSAPLLLQKWYWFYLSNGHTLQAQMNERPNAPLAILRGSGARHWLSQQQVNNLIEVSTTAQLPSLLLRNRVLAVLADEQVFLEALKDIKTKHQVSREFLKYSPIGILFNIDQLDLQPQLITKVNAHLDHCTRTRQLSRWEAEKLSRFAQSRLQRLNTSIDLESALLNWQSSISLAEIQTMDHQWRKEVSSQRYQLIAEFQQRPISQQLKRWQAAQAGYITEIIVTDLEGKLIAMSQVTSDFWQGDEEKVQRIQDGRSSYLSNIHYDNSTQQFQVQISYGIREKANHQLIGTLTLGLDVEKILRSDF